MNPPPNLSLSVVYSLSCFPIQLQIFGEDIQDASINQDLLVISHSNGLYRMYSLPWIIEHYTIVKATMGQYVKLEGMRAGTVGDYGFGIPLTVQLEGRELLCFVYPPTPPPPPDSTTQPPYTTNTGNPIEHQKKITRDGSDEGTGMKVTT